MSLPYYKRFPKDFLEGTIGMDLEVKGAYAVVLDLIYMRDGNLEDDPRYISGQLGCSVRKWNSIREKLIQAGKLTSENGIISNFRADYLVEERRKYRDKKAENAARSNENNDLAERPLSETGQSARVSSEPDKDTPVGGGDYAPRSGSKKALIYQHGIPIIQREVEKRDRAAAVVTKLLKNYGEAAVFRAVMSAVETPPVEPISYITAICKQDGEKPRDITVPRSGGSLAERLKRAPFDRLEVIYACHHFGVREEWDLPDGWREKMPDGWKDRMERIVREAA